MGPNEIEPCNLLITSLLQYSLTLSDGMVPALLRRNI